MPEVFNINPNDATVSLVVGASIASPTLTPTPPPKFTNGRKRKVDPSLINHYKKKPLEIEPQKVRLLTERSHNKEWDDDDLLHPFTKRIPMERKMAFRSRVQQSFSNLHQLSTGPTTCIPFHQYQLSTDFKENVVFVVCFH